MKPNHRYAENPGAMKNGSFWRATLWSLIGPLVWSTHFALVYGAQHVMCAIYSPGEYVYGFVTGVSILFIAMLLPFALASQRHSDRFGNPDWTESTQAFFITVMRLLVVLSIVGIVWASAGVFILPACGRAIWLET